MTRTTLTLIIVIIILSLAAGISTIFMALNPNKSKPALRNLSKNNETRSTVNILQELLQSDKNQKCPLSASVKNIPVKGFIYASQGTIKGEFVPEFAPFSINGNLLLDSGHLYIWTSMDNNGYKIPISAAEELSEKNSALADIIKVSKISCSPWSPDPNIFKLPADINFQTEGASNSSTGKLIE